MQYQCMIVGGGIAGLQAAIQLGRYDHRVLVLDSGYGRSTLCRCYHNVLGWPDGVSGEELRRLGRKQAEALGVKFVQDEVTFAEACTDERDECGDKRATQGSHEEPEACREGKERAMHAGFRLRGRSGAEYEGELLLLATGLLDRLPALPGLVPCLGLTVYVCPDCDSFEVKGRKTVVLGAGDPGARLALQLHDRTDELFYINHERTAVEGRLLEDLKRAGIGYRETEVLEVRASGDGLLTGLLLADGEELAAERGFLAFGGNKVNSELAGQLGVERHENRHILTDPRSKQTNVSGIWAAGDVGVHAEQVTIAMGEGSQAAIWMHRALASAVSRPLQ